MTHNLQDSDSLGADIRSIRKSRGITLIEISEKVERSVGWMSQVERDISQPSIDDLRTISSILVYRYQSSLVRFKQMPKKRVALYAKIRGAKSALEPTVWSKSCYRLT